MDTLAALFVLALTAWAVYLDRTATSPEWVSAGQTLGLSAVAWASGYLVGRVIR